ncbi:hypothetical protein [Streptomyces sp. NPDC046909]|uniref:hypothetical protein n=1 Tax=Streptomyces sp. NPDC046909 TaxID=3155617 RepID=UPI0033DBBFBE
MIPSFLRIPGRGGKLSDRLNRLVVITAFLGIGAGGWGLWLETDDALDRAASREKITRACGGLVDPDPVLGLNGGTDRARPGSDGEDVMSGLDDGSDPLAALPQLCVIYRVGEPGTSYGHFQLSAWQTPSDEYAQLVDGWDDPFEDWSGKNRGSTRRTADSAEYPLGDGRLGRYTDDAVTVKADCPNKPDGVTSVNVMAAALYDTGDAEVTDADRRTLATLARTAAERLADRTGCTTELPALRAELPTPGKRLTPAATAKGTCAWYAAYLGEQGRGRLPDRALATPAGTHASQESCLLAVSDGDVERIWSGLGEKEIGDRGDPGTPWWLRAESFFGDEAGEVKAEGLGTDQTALTPGTAGFDDSANVWWASATCAGEPALHTLTVPYPYDRYIRPRLRALFQAYVDDVAARRDCTGLEFPTDFSP